MVGQSVALGQAAAPPQLGDARPRVPAALGLTGAPVRAGAGSRPATTPRPTTRNTRPSADEPPAHVLVDRLVADDAADVVVDVAPAPAAVSASKTRRRWSRRCRAAARARPAPGCCSPSSVVIIAASVPKAIVDTGTPASAAAAARVGVGPAHRGLAVGHAARCGPAPARRRRPAGPRRWRRARRRWPRRWRCASASSRSSMARWTGSSVGRWAATATVATPLKVTRPRLISSGRSSTKSSAASWAASSRSGSTSVASIDSETSMASTTVARSSGTCVVRAGSGEAHDQRAPAPTRNSAGGTWRRQPGRSGRHHVEQRRGW